MKTNHSLSLLVLSGLVFTLASVSEARSKRSSADDLKNLGGNSELIKKARALNPKSKTRIVQKRAVDRTLRFEILGQYGYLAGGNPYVQSDNLGAGIDFHINPRWSLGARYMSFGNDLSQEGERIASKSVQERSQIFDATDNAKSSVLGTVAWYPVYGKLNLFDWRVAQFDIYALAGAGSVELESGSTSTWTAGGGVGIWWTQHFSSRLEARYQTYEAQPITGPQELDLTVLSLSFGLLL